MKNVKYIKSYIARKARRGSKKFDSVLAHKKILEEANELYARKNKDYGDSFHETYLEEGMAAVRIRLSDKLQRLKNLTRGNTQMVSDESIRDTLIDLLNYSAMAIIEIERENDN